MATFRKISNGLQMDGCDLYNYLMTSKGYCCEKGWLWEDLDTQMTMTGRDWLAYWALNGSPCAGCTAPVNLTFPTISGLPVVGQTLTGGDGTWSGTAPITYSYQWKRDGVDIVGETNNTYRLAAADIGADITFEVVANNACSGGGVSSLSGTFGPIAEGKYLEFAFADLSGAMPVVDYNSLAQWNALFSSTYTSLVVDGIGNTIRLYGGTGVVVSDLTGSADNLLSFYDTGTVFDVGTGSMSGCINLVQFVTAVGFNTASIGGNPAADNVFSGIMGNNMSITIPLQLMTCDGGNPDGDIAYLIAANTVTVTTF